MKIIFLDVDGVLNSDKYVIQDSGGIIDIHCIKILELIINKTGASIVLSSGRRLWLDENLMPTEEESLKLFNIFNEYKIKLFDKTPDFSTEEIRTKKTFSHVKAKEILAWLNEHKYVDKYVVIDDLDLKNDEINSHLIKIDSKVGLTENDAEIAIEMLNR